MVMPKGHERERVLYYYSMFSLDLDSQELPNRPHIS